MSETFVFYCYDAVPKSGAEPRLPPAYSWQLWTPSRGGVVPPGLPLLPFGIWTAMHHLRVFANGEYSVLLVHYDGRLVHRSALFPRYARFPFMARDDLQIGDVWTDPAHRNLGIASFAIRWLSAAKARRGRRIWYVVEPGNAQSVRVVTKLGFVRAGSGTRTKRLGLAVLSRFVMDSHPELV